MILSRRSLLQAGGALVVALSTPAGAQVLSDGDKALGKPLALTDLDSFLAIHADGTATLYSGKVDLGTGLRIAFRQMAAEELGISPDRIKLIEGDTALTPNQGPTAGSTGIARGGIEIRQAAATARAALIGMAAEKLNLPADQLEAVDGAVRPKAGGPGIGFGALVGDRRFGLKIDPKAPIKAVAEYQLVGKSLPRPDVPAKVTGRHTYVHDFALPGMLHARVVHPPAIGATLLSVDESTAGGARVVRIKDFLALVAEDEWTVVKALGTLKASWSDAQTLTGHEKVTDAMRAGPFEADEMVVKRGDPGPVLAAGKALTGTFYWPMQTHGSMGPSCAVADVQADKATIWTASQATHRYRDTYARMLGLAPAAVRLVYLDGAGCYGMNGHDDAAADAALISRAVGRPVRVQWTRQDEHGWDPKGPPQLLSVTATLDDKGNIGAWKTEMWIPKATANLPNVPLVGPLAAGLAQTPGLSTGLINQNASPPYACPHVEVLVHWLKDAPLRPSNIRAPGKIANTFAVESFVDELAVAAKRDAVEFRLAGLSDPRGIEVLRRAAQLMQWQARPSPGPGGVGRGMAYVHYKFNETYVAIGMEVAVDRASGAVKVQRIACAHDCGLMINPDAVRAQVEGNILQTLSRTLFEEVTFDRAGVTSLDWSSYPILTFPDVPKILIDLVDRPNDPPLGAGEAAAAPVGAALANAIFDAVGVRLRTVPLTPDRLKAAIG